MTIERLMAQVKYQGEKGNLPSSGKNGKTSHSYFEASFSTNATDNGSTTEILDVTPKNSFSEMPDFDIESFPKLNIAPPLSSKSSFISTANSVKITKNDIPTTQPLKKPSLFKRFFGQVASVTTRVTRVVLGLPTVIPSLIIATPLVFIATNKIYKISMAKSSLNLKVLKATVSSTFRSIKIYAFTFNITSSNNSFSNIFGMYGMFRGFGIILDAYRNLARII